MDGGTQHESRKVRSEIGNGGRGESSLREEVEGPRLRGWADTDRDSSGRLLQTTYLYPYLYPVESVLDIN